MLKKHQNMIYDQKADIIYSFSSKELIGTSGFFVKARIKYFARSNQKFNLPRKNPLHQAFSFSADAQKKSGRTAFNGDSFALRQ